MSLTVNPEPVGSAAIDKPRCFTKDEFDWEGAAMTIFECFKTLEVHL